MLIAANYLIPLGMKSYKGSRPVNNYYVNLPFVEPINGLDLDLLLATPVSDRLAMFSIDGLGKTSHSDLSVPLSVRDKQEHKSITQMCMCNQEHEAEFNYTFEEEPSIEEMDEILMRTHSLIPRTVEPLVECLSSVQPFPEPFENSVKETDIDNFNAAFYEKLLVDGNDLQKNLAKMRFKTIGAVN